METVTHSKIKRMSLLLIVADIEQSIEFYSQIIGFTVAFRYADFYAGIIKDGNSIHLKSGKPSMEERSARRNNQDLDIIFTVDDIEDLFEELSNKNVDIIQSLRHMPYGREFYISDPDGYIIGFVEEKSGTAN